jgi:protein-L-isoaspartate(D-aspartate) O-methyltransferase
MDQRITRMLADIRAHTRQSAPFTGRTALAPRVLEALARVPREAFVPAPLQARAWDDSPLPIGRGQTISQPFIVALMTDLLDPGPDARVLEIGTGCGYQTAVLARLAARVYSIEILPELAREAAARLAVLGRENLETRAGDGYHGWPEQAPFDGILVTAAAPAVPPPLLDQLAPGGRLVLPLGPPGGSQELHLLARDTAGRITARHILPVAFVPLTGTHGEPEN